MHNIDGQNGIRRPSAEEEARAGLRRGRSAAGVPVPDHGDDEEEEQEDDQGNSDRDDNNADPYRDGRGTPEPERIPRKTRTPRATPTPDVPSRGASRAPAHPSEYEASAPQFRAGSLGASGDDAHDRGAARSGYQGGNASARDYGTGGGHATQTGYGMGYAAWNGQGMGQKGYGGGGYAGPHGQYAGQQGLGPAGWQGSASNPPGRLPQVDEEGVEEH